MTKVHSFLNQCFVRSSADTIWWYLQLISAEISLKISLTPITPLIHTWFEHSKWNMGEICGLKFHLSDLHTPHRFFLNHSIHKKGYFCCWAFNFVQKSSCLWSKKMFKNVLRKEEFQKYFFKTTFHHHF